MSLTCCDYLPTLARAFARKAIRVAPIALLEVLYLAYSSLNTHSLRE